MLKITFQTGIFSLVHHTITETGMLAPQMGKRCLFFFNAAVQLKVELQPHATSTWNFPPTFHQFSK